MDHESLVSAATSVLLESDAFSKKSLTDAIVRDWNDGCLVTCRPDGADLTAPEQPSRDDRVEIVAPRHMPKLGKGGTLASRQAIIHSLVHIESCAVDLSWDIIARFGSDPAYRDYLPRQFFDDFVEVAEDECRHFTQLAQRLQELGSDYGAFPAHEGLWQSARETAGSLPARLAVEHCVHEARGLDVLPLTIQKFRKAGDDKTAALLEQVVLPEEIRHCAAGVRWLKHLHGVAHGRCFPSESSQEGAHACARGTAAEQAGPDVALSSTAAECGHTPQPAVVGNSGSEAVEIISGNDQSGCACAGGRDADGRYAHDSCTAARAAREDAELSPAATNGYQRTQLQGERLSKAEEVEAEEGEGCSRAQTEGQCHKHNPHIKVAQHGREIGAEPAWMAEARRYETVERWFHALVRAHFKGNTKPPFNETAREQAGLTEAWYKPLTT